MKGEGEVCISGGWWSAHSGADNLEPVGISELENIVFHNKAKCFGEGVNGDAFEAGFSLVDVLRYLSE